MKKKKLWISLISLAILTVVGFGIYNYYTKQDSNSTLTILEKQWIEGNKNRVIDLSIKTDIPILNYNGSGLILDFIADLENATNLKFNKLAYNGTEESVSDYVFQIKDTVENNDILFYEDHYVLLAKENKSLNTLDELKDMSIGILTDDLQTIDTYLNVGQNITYKTYDSVDALVLGLENDEVASITLPRLENLDKIISNENINIIYHLTEYKKYYVLTLGDVNNLNNILNKYFDKWNNESFDKKFNTYLTSNYFEMANISQKAQASFKSKRYTYGILNNYPYDAIESNYLVGINSNILKAFSSVTGVEIEYTETFDSINDLVKQFNKNEIDFFFGINSNTKYEMDTYKTVSILNEEMVILTTYANDFKVNSLKSLINKTVWTVKNTKISEELEALGIDIKGFDNVEDLLKSMRKDSILALDYETYKYYVHNELQYHGIAYRQNLNSDYGYIIRDIEDNEVFSKYLDFFISFTDRSGFVNNAYNTLLVKEEHINLFTLFLVIIGGIVVGLFAIFGLYKYIHIGAKKITKMNKNDKIKYIDMLTSLKNRNYLNDNIEAWDESEIYPQSIIVVDLNNVAYINDNYGHQEGDNVIKEAANILIKTQIDNSDIIRTSGNEFLVYLVGHDEKEIVAYVRKLNKEMKTLAHGFGAAVGYSMITDAIKTIDDAVNEATLDMRTQKEEASNN